MLGMLDLEITVLFFCFFILNLLTAGEHISVSCLHVFIFSLQDEISFIGFKTRLCCLYHLTLAIQKIKLGSLANFISTSCEYLEYLPEKQLRNCYQMSANIIPFIDTCKTNSDASCFFKHSYLESWSSSINPKFFCLFVFSQMQNSEKSKQLE